MVLNRKPTLCLPCKGRFLVAFDCVTIDVPINLFYRNPTVIYDFFAEIGRPKGQEGKSILSASIA